MWVVAYGFCEGFFPHSISAGFTRSVDASEFCLDKKLEVCATGLLSLYL